MRVLHIYNIFTKILALNYPQSVNTLFASVKKWLALAVLLELLQTIKESLCSLVRIYTTCYLFHRLHGRN